MSTDPLRCTTPPLTAETNLPSFDLPLTEAAAAMAVFADRAGKPRPGYNTLRRLTLDGTIRSHRIGGKVMLAREDLPRAAQALGFLPVGEPT